jgi:6-pyruvoyltetrahydropterin/6-carboxytetrahydropterin synthase
MYHMTVEGRFSAAHCIREHPGACRNLHGHNYRVVVHLTGSELDPLGMLIDYGDVKRALAAVLDPYDHAYLNDLPDFATVNPTSEGLARTLFGQLKDTLLISDDLRRRVRVREVVVFEAEHQGVGYGEE